MSNVSMASPLEEVEVEVEGEAEGSAEEYERAVALERAFKEDSIKYARDELADVAGVQMPRAAGVKELAAITQLSQKAIPQPPSGIAQFESS